MKKLLNFAAATRAQTTEVVSRVGGEHRLSPSTITLLEDRASVLIHLVWLEERERLKGAEMATRLAAARTAGLPPASVASSSSSSSSGLSITILVNGGEPSRMRLRRGGRLCIRLEGPAAPWPGTLALLLEPGSRDRIRESRVHDQVSARSQLRPPSVKECLYTPPAPQAEIEP